MISVSAGTLTEGLRGFYGGIKWWATDILKKLGMHVRKIVWNKKELRETRKFQWKETKYGKCIQLATKGQDLLFKCVERGADLLLVFQNIFDYYHVLR